MKSIYYTALNKFLPKTIQLGVDKYMSTNSYIDLSRLVSICEEIALQNKYPEFMGIEHKKESSPEIKNAAMEAREQIRKKLGIKK